MLPLTGKTLKLKLMAAEASVDSECAQRWHKTHRATNYPSRKVVHVHSHTKPPTTGVQKSLVSSISCMTCELSDYTARGFWASDVQRCSKSPALIPEKREYKGAGDPWHYNQNNLKWSSNTTEGYAAATQRLEKAVEWKWLKLDKWLCQCKILGNQNRSLVLGRIIAMTTLVPRCRQPLQVALGFSRHWPWKSYKTLLKMVKDQHTEIRVEPPSILESRCSALSSQG